MEYLRLGDLPNRVAVVLVGIQLQWANSRGAPRGSHQLGTHLVYGGLEFDVLYLLAEIASKI